MHMRDDVIAICEHPFHFVLRIRRYRSRQSRNAFSPAAPVAAIGLCWM
jgi:hypothetical protein